MNRNKLFLVSIFSLLILPSIQKRNVKALEFEGRTLVIYNVEDYISNGEEGSVDLVAKFESETGATVKYYSYDTNETMYNQFKLQKEGTYDLVLASDYMIQKMAKEGLIDPIENLEENIPNYYNGASKILRSKLQSMKVTVDGVETDLDKYAIGYMWGTLGIIYDANASETIREDVKHWDVFYDKQYDNLISIKNSMRDAYDVGLIHSFAKEEKYQQLLNDYLENYNEQTARAFNDYLQSIFDFKFDGSAASEEENYDKIARVKEELINLKDNIFGFETDSGKNDIVEGSKIKLNLAYSGDAVNSIDTAYEELGKVLEYVVPEDGGNIWYDAWMLPKGSHNRDLAYAFLDFISSNESAAANMDYICYTPFIVGDEMFNVAVNYYGAADFDINQTYYEGDHVIFEQKLYVCVAEEISEVNPTDENCFECYDIEDTTLKLDYEDGQLVSHDGLIYYYYYEDGIVLEEVEPYDLTHIFGDSLETRRPLIYPYDGLQNKLETQYPSQKIIDRCAIMNDYGEYNDAVIIMWGQIKAYTNMTPYYIILIVFASGFIGLISYSIISKRISTRYKRNKAKGR